MAHLVVWVGLIGIGVFIARCVDWHREKKIREAEQEADRKKTSQAYHGYLRSNAGGWVILFLLVFTGCDNNTKTITGMLVERQPTKNKNEYSLRFKNGTEWLVTDNGGHPWPMGREVKVRCEMCGPRAIVQDVADIEQQAAEKTTPSPPTTLPDEPLKSPTGKPPAQKKVLFSGQTQMGELVIYENEYNHSYLSDFQVQTENDSVTITKKVKK